MLNILFYIFGLPTGIMAMVVLLKTLTGTARGTSTTSEKIVATLASLIVLGMLYWAFGLAIKQKSPGLGIGVIILSWIIFGSMMLLSGFRNTKLWN
jgi:hypothetical protein